MKTLLYLKLYLDRAALVSGISDKRPMRYRGKFQCVVSLKSCLSLENGLFGFQIFFDHLIYGHHDHEAS